jgi:glycosyltransferase involved in cell wall biosynthesis
LNHQKKRKLAIIIPGGIGTGKGNMGVPVLERIVKLLALEFDITIFQLFAHNKDYHAKGFRLVSVISSNVFPRTYKLIVAFWKLHRKEKFHAVHGFWALPSGFFAVLIGKIFKVRSIVSILGGDAVSLPEINYGQLRNHVPRQLVFWTLQKSDHVISLTQYLIDNLFSIGFKHRKIHIIPWGIDTNLFTYRAKSLSQPVRFLHIGNLNAVKDQDTLLRAFKNINDKIEAHLTMVGEGILESRIKNLVQELGLSNKVAFIPPMQYELLPDIYHQADILLHTSLSEGQCEVVTEAMSAGVVVCGTRVGLMYDVQPDCCAAVAIKDFQALSDEVIAIVNDPEKSDRLREAARDWAVHHSLQWTVEQMSKLYRQ